MDAVQLVAEVARMHYTTVERWHQAEVDNPYQGFLAIACRQHQFNFLLWHEEDIARSPSVGDARIAGVKREIDRLNQQRNDWIEKLDDTLLETLKSLGRQAPADAPLNTETPGSAIDRLSIMSLRIYHLAEQLERPDVDQRHHNTVAGKLQLCREQHQDLSTSLTDLLLDIFAGRRRLKLYRQMKMYNDPALNPYLYGRKAG